MKCCIDILGNFVCSNTEVAEIKNHCYHDPQFMYMYNESLQCYYLLTAWCQLCFCFSQLRILPTVLCITFPSTFVATPGRTSRNWQKFLIWWWGKKCHHHWPHCEYNCSHLSASLPFPVNHWSQACWNVFCCLRHWSALPNHKCNRTRSGDKCIHYNCCGKPSSFSYCKVWTEF